MFLIYFSMYSIYFSYIEIYILLFCATLQNDHNINLFSDSRIMATTTWDKKRKREKGKEGKGKIIFSKSLFLKISPNNELHKIPVLSSDFPDLAKLPGIRSRSQTGEYTPQPPEYYLSSKSNIHFVMSYNPSTAVFCKSAKIIINKPVDLVCGGGYENIYRANPALPSPLRGQSQSHLSKTTSNNTSKESHNCRISRVFQIL